MAAVDEYIAGQPAATQSRLRELRAIFVDALPGAVESISYGLPTYKWKGGKLYFGAAKHHCAIYGSAADALGDELRGLVGEKGTVRFPLSQPVPEALIRKLIAATIERYAAKRLSS
ncbi:MAG TPA: DUF1801 domain-containing protein [Chloroflexota bacterium]|jgi:uncharacterized protein YdhG (YjbR/CyaY superfamily)